LGLWAVAGDLSFLTVNDGFCRDLLAIVGDWAIYGIYAAFLGVYADIVG
jgi:hypothetical protein